MANASVAEMNPHTLPSALDRVYEALAAGRRSEDVAGPSVGASSSEDRLWSPFDHLAALFGLSSFERDLLVLCSGFSLESRFAAAASDATFGLALTVLEDPHWSAVTASGPLRYWQLVTVGSGNLLDAPLHLDERILEFVLGVPAFDERLEAVVRPVATGAPASSASLHSVALGARHWSRVPAPREPLLLIARHRFTRESAFAQICHEVGLRPYGLDVADIPLDGAEREQLARRWTREATLAGAALYLRTEDCESVRSLRAWLELTGTPVALEVRPGSPVEQLDGLRLHLAPTTSSQRQDLWRESLGPLAERMDGQVERIAEYFEFDEPAIRMVAAHARETLGDDPDGEAKELCWAACREHGRRSLETLARRIDATAGWDALVLPEPQIRTLRQIAIHMRRRAVVNDQWGFSAKHARGVGLTVMFSGASGTGKTLAAEILAADLELDLYRVDLASVVSKWLGETEKNLRAIFEGAERSGAILLFDEADSLFGKRSEVRDSHDRYANLEISYLLQQMEAYRGIAILTTNMQHAIDPAFMRRIRFIVQFPFPDAAARESIWRGIFPEQTPLGDLDFQALARLNVSGGVIRNIATLAAFLAADDTGLVETGHLHAAARTEYAKLDKLLTPAEGRGLA